MRVGQTAMGMALLSTMLLVCPAAARAEGDKATADALFEEARALVEAGKFAEACDKFAESERLDPSVGTLLNLGECHERLGRTASAYAAFGKAKELAAERGEKEREAYAGQRHTALGQRLSRIALSLPLGVSGVKVLVDARELDAKTFGEAIPVDPGRHRVNAVAPGKRPFEREVVVGSEAVTVMVNIDFPEEKRVLATAPAMWNPMRRAGVIVGAVGVVGGLVGAGFGIAAISKNDASKEACSAGNPNACPDERGVELRSRAGTFADVSTGVFVGSAVLVGAGVGLFVVGGRMAGAHQKDKPLQAERVQVIPVVGSGVGGVVVRMEF